MAYFVVRILRLSKLPTAIPCSEKIAKKIVNVKPTLHLNRLDINPQNLSNFTLSLIFEMILKTKLNKNNGKIKKLKKSATYVEIIDTTGLYALALAVPPNAIVRVNINGNKMLI